MMKWLKLAQFALVAASVFASGCQRNHPPSLALTTPTSPDTVEVRRNVQFADLPSPREFKFNRKYSRNFQGSSLRGGKVVYDGTWNVAETYAWYVEEMPKTGWTLISQDAPTDNYVNCTFRKNSETVSMRIRRSPNLVRVEFEIDKIAP